MRKDFTKIDGDFKVVVDLAYPPGIFERQQKGTRTNYNAQNKQMFGVKYNKESKEIIFAAMKNFKLLIRNVLDKNKTFLVKILKRKRPIVP